MNVDVVPVNLNHFNKERPRPKRFKPRNNFKNTESDDTKNTEDPNFKREINLPKGFPAQPKIE